MGTHEEDEHRTDLKQEAFRELPRKCSRLGERLYASVDVLAEL